MTGPVSACWAGENARRIFVTEALEGGDAIFLATHSPITGFEVSGRDAGEIAEADEQSVLEVLSDPERRHAFCVVQGEPGSGKSHLIRWLSINWPEGNDIKLLLRRADGSLEGALKQLKERLPEEFKPLLENLGERQTGTREGRINMFAVGLGATLEPGYFSRPIGDEKWCTEFAPADLIGFPDVRKAWNGPARILNLLDGAGGERNSETAAFNLLDIENLAEGCRYLKPTAVDARARELARRLEREAEIIGRYRAKEWLADEMAADAAEHFPTSLALMRALNARKNEAIRNVIGVSADRLKSVFRDLREKLAPRGQRLVLLLEDITSWEGLDDSLMDVLVDNAEAHGGDGEAQICPLISVVGITPDFYDRLPGNNRQRITHEIKLGHSSGGLQDVATMRESDDRRRFVARYLAAVRAGLPALESWREEALRLPGTPPPNACEGCPRREACFATFGDEEGIGLFPFTSGALDRFFDALKENDNGQTWRTPRGLLQAVLNPNLIQPDALEEARFPVALIETNAIREERRPEHALSNMLDRIVANRIEDGAEQARMRRMLSYWADPNQSETTSIDGELAFAGARRSLFDAFGLEWLGGDQAGEAAYAPPAMDPGPASEDEDEDGGAAFPLLPDEDDEEAAPSPAFVGQPRWGKAPQAPARAPVIPPKPKRLNIKRSELETAQHQLRNWAKGGSIPNPSSWNKLLYELICAVDPRRLGVSPHLFDRIVTQEMIKLQGSTTATRNYLMIDAEPWVRDGLEAYLKLKVEKGTASGEAAFHRRNLALMMRRLEKLAGAYIDTRLPKDESGKRWSPAAGLAQVLVGRAWLRGTISPEASVPDHMSAILSDEGEPLSDLRARSMPWQEWLNASDKWHERFRAELRGMVSLAIGEGAGGAGLTDASEIAAAIERMKETGQVDEVPAEDGGLPELLKRGRELAESWRAKRALIDRTEAKQLTDRSEALSSLLRGRSVANHLARVDDAVTRVAALMKEASPDSVFAWKQAYARLRPRLEEGVAERLEGFLVELADEEDGVPAKAAPRIGWLARAPAKELTDVLEVANLGEKLVGDLLAHVRDCVREAKGTASLSEVQRIGAALVAASGLASEAKEAAE
jgi:hypothetical protein